MGGPQDLRDGLPQRSRRRLGRSLVLRMALFVALLMLVIMGAQVAVIDSVTERLVTARRGDVVEHIAQRISEAETGWAAQAFALRSAIVFGRVLQGPDRQDAQARFHALVTGLGATREFDRADVLSDTGEQVVSFSGWQDRKAAPAPTGAWLYDAAANTLHRVVRTPLMVGQGRGGMLVVYLPLDRAFLDRLRVPDALVSLVSPGGDAVVGWASTVGNLSDMLAVGGKVLSHSLPWTVDGVAAPRVDVTVSQARIFTPWGRALWMVAMVVFSAMVTWLFFGRWVRAQVTGPLAALASGIGAWRPGTSGDELLGGAGVEEVRVVAGELAGALQRLNNTEQELREGQERFREFAELRAKLLWETDADCRYTGLWGPVAMTAGVENLLGKTRDEAAADEGMDIHSEPWASMSAALRRQEPIREVEYQRYRPGHGLIWASVSAKPRFDAQGRFLGYRGVAADISATKALRDELASVNARLLHLVAAAPGAMYTMRSGDGAFTFVSDALGAQVGHLVGDVLADGAFWSGCIHPEDLPAYRGAIAATMASGRAGARYRIRAVSGDYVWIADEMRAAGGGEIVGLWTNISERVAEEQRMGHVQKMQSIGELTGALAHDFNNLLGIVIANLDVVEGLVGADARAVSRLNVAKSAALRGAGVTRSLLSVASQQVATPVVTDVGEAVSEAMPLLQAAVGGGLTIDLDLPARPVHARLDSSGLIQALLNLVMNARDATESTAGSRNVRIAVRGESVAQTSDPAIAPGRYVAVSVEDNGVGMSAEVLKRAFEPFFTTKGIGRGTGLGLAMVYGYARQFGGGADIRTRPGQGTTVRILLPDMKPAQAAATVARAEVPAPGKPVLAGGAGKRVLVLEDEVDLCDMACAMLTMFGFLPVAAKSVDEARGLLAQEPFDIIFSDITMPGSISGLDFAAEARGRFPGMLVLLTSGYSEELLASGARGFPLLQKPYRMRELSEAMQRLVDSGAA